MALMVLKCGGGNRWGSIYSQLLNHHIHFLLLDINSIQKKRYLLIALTVVVVVMMAAVVVVSTIMAVQLIELAHLIVFQRTIHLNH